jgi:hypothetical protein
MRQQLVQVGLGRGRVAVKVGVCRGHAGAIIHTITCALLGVLAADPVCMGVLAGLVLRIPTTGYSFVLV